MIYFTPSEIFASLLYGAIYGVICAFLFAFMRILRRLIVDLGLCVKQIFVYGKVRDMVVLSDENTWGKASGALTFFGIIAFTLGFIILSYIALDGMIRVYLLTMVFASFYLSKIAFSSFFERILLGFLRLVLTYETLILRFLFYPFCSIYRKMLTKFVKKRR